MGYQEFRGGMKHMSRSERRLTLSLLILLVTLSLNITSLSAQSPNVGRLRIARFQSPRQVAPNSLFLVSLDVEYAVRENATMRAAIFRTADNSQLWQSDVTKIAGGGDKVWDIKLSAPPVETMMQLSAYAYFQDNGVWKYYNGTLNGPGSRQISIKVAKNANMQIDLGVGGVQFTVSNMPEKTSPEGSMVITLPVGDSYTISLPQSVELGNSTRVVFQRWNDGDNHTQRSVLLDGDVNLAGSYRTQYQLHVASILPNYSYTKWVDAGANVTLQAVSTASMGWSLGPLNLMYNFTGWSGDVNSQSLEIRFTMNSPKTVNANYSLDYRPLTLPTIFLAGILGTIILALLRRKMGSGAHHEPEAEHAVLRCKNCESEVEEDWKHCIQCGAKLGEPVSVDDRER